LTCESVIRDEKEPQSPENHHLVSEDIPQIPNEDSSYGDGSVVRTPETRVEDREEDR
jgi:hypothetical protein